MKKWIWRLPLALLGLYFLTALFVVPYLVRTKLPAVVHEATGGTLSIERVSFNPLVLNFEMHGIRFLAPDGSLLFRMQRFHVNVDVVHLLWGELSIEHIGFYGPKLYVVQQQDGRFNFDWLLHLNRDSNATAQQADTDTHLPDVVLEHFELEDGGISFTDLSRPKPLQMKLEPIGLSMTDIVTRGKGANRLHFYGGTGSGGMLDVRSTIGSFEPFAMHGRVEYNAGKLYLAYHFLQSISKLEVADGRIHAALDFAVDTADLNATVVDDINVTLRRLRVVSKEDHADVLRIGSLAVAAGPVYPLRRNAAVGSVSLDDAYVFLQRLRDGSFNWQHFFPAADAATPAAGGAQQTAQDAAPPWKAVIRNLALHSAQLRFEDRTLAIPATATVDDFNLTLSPISTDKTLPIHFENRFAVNRTGSIEANGSVTLEPLHAEADVAVNGFALPPFSPYVEDKVYARIERGRVFATARIAYAPSQEHSDLTARGDFRLDDLLVNDPRDAMPLASIAALKAKAYLFELLPNRLFVDTVDMDAFYANVVIDANKTLNLAALMKPETEAAAVEEANATATPQASSGEFPVRIVRFVVKNGAVHFADESLPLPFDTQIHDVNGEVLGISNVREDTTFLRLDGEIDRYGVAKAEGSLNTGDPKAYTDIGVAFRNIDLSSFTPYSGKFVGRAIDGGKLSVTLRYNIVDSVMKGDNGMIINKIVLGDSIESRDAVSLPLDFAIALLEDSDGVIDIDMPVRGDVDNPDFKWGGVVWNAFVNLLTKAVTAPFALIGSMLGIEGDMLKYIPFEPGSAAIDASSRERLDLLAKALEKRPKLGITVGGTYAIAVDTAALKRTALIKAVLGTGAKESIAAQDALVPALLEPIYEQRLGKAALETLKDATMKQDMDDEGKQRFYTQRLIGTLIETQPLPANALNDLARLREQAIRSYLVINHAVNGSRIKDETPQTTEVEGGFVASQIGLDAVK